MTLEVEQLAKLHRRDVDETRNALARARQLSLPVAIVAVDRGGHIVTALRRDLAPYMVIETARRKAATAAAMNSPTTMVAEFAASDAIVQNALHNTPDILAVPGGVPIVIDGVCVGGIGVAGGHYSEDHEVLDWAVTQFAGREVSSD